MDRVSQAIEAGSSLEELKVAWWALPRTSEAEQKVSEEFYKSQVFPKVLEQLCRDESNRPQEEYDLLISPLGTSPEPLMITISLLQPSRVVFLCSPDTEKFIATIVARTGIQSIHKHYVEKDDTLPIYEAVHAAIQEEAQRLGRAPRVAIDMTGGTKLMGAGCAMAGVLIGAHIYYLAAGNFDPTYRRPIPGTEHLVRFQDPYASFGHLEADQALARFGRHDYSGAAQVFEEVAEKVAKPRTYEALGHLCRAYQAWDALRLGEAVGSMGKACGMIRKFRADSPLMRSLPLEVLERQRAALERLHSALSSTKLSLALLQDPEVFSPLLFTVLENASRRKERGSYEAASLLLYRAIEMMAQRRLALMGVDTARVDYRLLGIDPVSDAPSLSSKLKIGRDILMGPLPERVSLFLAHALLAWKKDPYCWDSPPLDLGHLNHLISIRNEGLYAHGFKPAEESSHRKFEQFTDICLRRLCHAEGWDLEKRRAECRFIRLPETARTYGPGQG